MGLDDVRSMATELASLVSTQSCDFRTQCAYIGSPAELPFGHRLLCARFTLLDTPMEDSPLSIGTETLTSLILLRNSHLSG